MKIVMITAFSLLSSSVAYCGMTCKTVTFAQTADLSMNDDYLAQQISQICDDSKPFAVTQVLSSMDQHLYPAGYKICCQPPQQPKKTPAKS